MDPMEHVGSDLAALTERLGQIYIQWCVRAPSLEASSALAAMAQEHAGYQRVLTRLANGSVADRCPVNTLETTPDSWPALVGVAGTAEMVLAALLARMQGLGGKAASRSIAKLAIELSYHARLFRGWFVEMLRDASLAGSVFVNAKAGAESELAGWLATLDGSLTGLEASLILDSTAAREDDEQPGSELWTCAHCGSADVHVLAPFGPSLMTSQLSCDSCDGFFEVVRWVSSGELPGSVASVETPL